MTAVAAPASAPPRARTDRGWFLFFQVTLLFAALMFMPFGARDAAGVSSVLPALRPAAPDARRSPEASSSVEGEPVTTPPATRRIVVAAVTAVLLVVAVGRPTTRRPPHPSHRLRPAAPLARRGRAPPRLV